MLIIRKAQINALAEHDVQEFRALVIYMVEHKYLEALAGSPVAYLERLVDAALVICMENGFDRQGSIIEFAEALVKDDVHPMSDPDIDTKVQRVMREFRSREVYIELQALAASVAGPAAGINGADAAASNPTQER